MRPFPSTVFLPFLLLAPLAAQSVVINEVSYDQTGADDGNVFVELYGAPNTDISGWRLQSIEGGSGTGSANPQSFVFPANTLIPLDGFVVVADGISGVTMVPNADFVINDMDLENGPDALQLINAGGAFVDAVAYGPVVQFPTASANGLPYYEGTPARDVFAPLSIERCPTGNDTGDNDRDFTPNEPTPGYGEACCTAIEFVSQGSGNSLSLSAGDSVGLDAWFGPCGANQQYVFLAALTNPAVVPPPPPFPVYDALTAGFLGFANLGPFVNWYGVLDGNGRVIGQTALDFSVLPATVGATFNMWVGAVALDGSFTIIASTNSVQITLNP